MTSRQISRPAHRAPRTKRAFGRGVIVVTVGASVLGVAGTAEAYFKAAAGGTGNASGGSVSLLTNGTPTVSATKLYPGGPATSLNFDVVNPNSRPVSI